MDACVYKNCYKFHTAAKKHINSLTAGIHANYTVHKWQYDFSVADFEKYYMKKLEVDTFIEMEQAQRCVQKCRRAEVIFNRATVLNQECTGNFIEKCISEVGLKDFRNYSTNDPSTTKE